MRRTALRSSPAARIAASTAASPAPLSNPSGTLLPAADSLCGLTLLLFTLLLAAPVTAPPAKPPPPLPAPPLLPLLLVCVAVAARSQWPGSTGCAWAKVGAAVWCSAVLLLLLSALLEVVVTRAPERRRCEPIAISKSGQAEHDAALPSYSAWNQGSCHAPLSMTWSTSCSPAISADRFPKPGS
jgi:hypothetical protein